MSITPFVDSFERDATEHPPLAAALSATDQPVQALRVLLRLAASGWSFTQVADLLDRDDTGQGPDWLLLNVLSDYQHLPPDTVLAWLEAFHGQPSRLQGAADTITVWHLAAPGRLGPLAAASGLDALEAAAMVATGLLTEQNAQTFSADG